MKAKKRLVLSSMMAAAAAACVLAEDQLGQQHQALPPASKAELSASAATNQTIVPELPVIVYLERRGQTIIVKAGPKGPVYSVTTAEGKTLFENVSAEQLRAQAPEIGEFIKTAVAGGSGSSGVVTDASVRPQRSSGTTRGR